MNEKYSNFNKYFKLKTFKSKHSKESYTGNSWFLLICIISTDTYKETNIDKRQPSREFNLNKKALERDFEFEFEFKYQ